MTKVAIAGFGAEGKSTYEYFAKQGADITIFGVTPKPTMSLPPGAKRIVGKDIFTKLHDFDLVVRSPSIRPDIIKTDGELTSQVAEFFKACPAPIIGVTGSKGKGTTASLIHLMLQAAGFRSHLAGNVGLPALDILPDVRSDDVVVLELSSFQLWDLKQSPQVAVVLMVEPEHLDIHKDLNEYIEAKSNITLWQQPSDVTVYLPDNDLTKRVALNGKGKKIPYTHPPGAHVEIDVITMGGQTICRVDEVLLPGQHNIDNACAAVTAVWQFTQDTIAIAKALQEFDGLEHRLKLVDEIEGVKYYDDSIATTPASAIAALKAFVGPKVIILGGSEKGADFTELGQAIASQNMRGVILVGAMRNRLDAAIKNAGYEGQLAMFDEQSTMQQIVQKAKAMTKAGDTVILSPACASFDMFNSYADRGDQFIAAVKALA